MAIRISILALALAFALDVAALSQQPRVGPHDLAVGDTVVAVQSCVLQNGQAVTNLPNGVHLRVVALNGDWVGCSGFVNGKEEKGWIRKSLVVKETHGEKNGAFAHDMMTSAVAPRTSIETVRSWGSVTLVLGAGALVLALAIVALVIRHMARAAQWRSFWEATENGDLLKVKALLANTPDLALSTNEYGRTPLHVAAENGHKDVVDLLLAKGAKVNAKSNDSNRHTPLHLATDNKDVVDLLLANKADVNVKGGYCDYTPLHAAAHGGNKDVVELLLAHKAEVNAKTNDKRKDTPLNWAVNNNHKDIAELLYQNGGVYTYNGGEDQEALHILVNDLLASDRSTREGAFLVAREMARRGTGRAVEGLALAIRQKAGDATMYLNNPTSKWRIFDGGEAYSLILDIAKRRAICKEAMQVMGALEGMSLGDSTAVKSFLGVLQEVGGDEQVHEFQLVGTYWQALAAYRSSVE